MSQKELVLEAIQELPDDALIDQIADRVEFIAAIQKGIDDIDRGDTIPHEEIKRQLAHGSPNNLVSDIEARSTKPGKIFIERQPATG